MNFFKNLEMPEHTPLYIIYLSMYFLYGSIICTGMWVAQFLVTLVQHNFQGFRIELYSTMGWAFTFAFVLMVFQFSLLNFLVRKGIIQFLP